MAEFNYIPDDDLRVRLQGHFGAFTEPEMLKFGVMLSRLPRFILEGSDGLMEIDRLWAEWYDSPYRPRPRSRY